MSERYGIVARNGSARLDTLPMILANSAPMKAFAINGAAEITIQAAVEGEPKKRPTFSISAYNGGAINVGYYGRCVVDLKGLRASGPVPILLDHDATQIVGQGKAKISREGVTVDGQITGDDEPAAKVTMHAKNGFRWSASVGVAPEKIEYVGEGKFVKVNGQEFTGPIQVCRAGRLGEVSFVAVGADETATASIAASAAKGTVMSYEQWLKARGLTLDGMSDVQQAALKASYDAEISAGIVQPVQAAAPVATPDVQPVVDATADIRASAATEIERIAEIRRVCAENGNPTMTVGTKKTSIEAEAIRAGWTVEKTELEAIRAGRTAPMAFTASGDAGIAALPVLEAAACVAGKIQNADKLFAAPVLEAARKRFRHGIGLQELFLEAAWANGYTGRSFRSDPSAVIRAAFSTSDFSGILSNIANKFLLQGFTSVEDTWMQIAATRPVSDFKTVTSYRLTGGFEYQQVAPTGELKHATAGEESFTNKADTYGIMFAVTRTDQINDDLGALTAVPLRIGRGGALKLNTVFWTAFLNNSTFFKTANRNYASGAGSALSVAGLTAAELLFLNQVDPDSKPLAVAPEILLVPNALFVTGTQLMRDTEVRDTTASTKYTTGNPHAGKFRVVRSSYLSNSTITGYSAAAWYLLANPASLPVVEVAFLNGNQTPTVETAEADFNVLGVQMRGYHDFGVALQDYRGGVKSAGA